VAETGFTLRLPKLTLPSRCPAAAKVSLLARPRIAGPGQEPSLVKDSFLAFHLEKPCDACSKKDVTPWRKLMWCIGVLSEEYRHRMYALLELYARPLSAAEPVICIDEKSLQFIGHTLKRRWLP
jgi:hypothetical protein